jgi:hypothetical protein
MSSIATVDTSAMGCSINNAVGNASIEGIEDVATGSALVLVKLFIMDSFVGIYI